MKFVRLDAVRVAAFFFTTRPKDYGGVHLGVSPADAATLDALLDELARYPPGHTRRVPVTAPPATLPARILPRGHHEPLQGLRIGTPIDGRTSVYVTSGEATIRLAPAALARFRALLDEAFHTGGDMCLAGDSEEWNDRLWVWPM
jgi:hypothetical protein